MAKMNVHGQTISLQTVKEEDYISLTDIARYKSQAHTDELIRNWLRNRNTLELLGIWERLNNPAFKPVEFDGFKQQAGLNSFTLTPKQWIEATAAIPDKKGNMRDEADMTQLVCLSNLENLNALFIADGLPQAERLERLNRIAIHQMTLLTGDDSMTLIGGKP